MFARALRWRVSANDEFLFIDTFELDPCAASAARLVNGGALFADNAFQTAMFHFLEQPFGIAADRARVANRITRVRAEFFENVLARLQRQPDQAFAVELEQVECVKINGRFSSFYLARLQKLERRAALVVERNYFAVNHAFSRRQVLYRRSEERRVGKEGNVLGSRDD